MPDNSNASGSTALAEPGNDQQPEPTTLGFGARVEGPGVPAQGTTIPIEKAQPVNTYAQYDPAPEQPVYQQPVPQQAYVYPPAEGGRATHSALWVILGVLLAIIVFGAVLLFATFAISNKLVGNTNLGTVGTLTTDTSSIPAVGLSSADISLDMGAGNIRLAGATSNLVDGKFTYNVAEWEPQIDYTTSGAKGVYEVNQPKTNTSTWGNMRNDWDLQLSGSVPTNVKINLGAGNVNANLGGLSIRTLNIDNHTGNTTVDLSGDWKNDLTATITGAVGNTTLRVPSDVGVRVVTHKDLGNITVNGLKADGNVYTNDLYGKSSVTLNIDTTVRLGNLVIETIR